MLERTSSWIERLARLGYAAKGVVYATIGLLAAGAPLGRRAETPDRQDAISFLLSRPLGKPLLAVMVLGLFGYATWRICSGFLDSERHGHDIRGLLLRGGSIVRGLLYASFGFGIARQLLHYGGAGPGSDANSRHWTASAMEHPFGRWAVALAGLVIAGYGAYEIVRAVGKNISKHLDLAAVSATNRKVMLAVSRVGMVARAIVFGVIGFSLIRAAIRFDPSAARGTSGALQKIAAQPHGAWLLTAVGLGLIAYGAYAFINARYRRIEVN